MRSAFLRGPRPGYIFAAMLTVALAVGFPLYFQGVPLLLAAFFGAVCGVLGIWLVAYSTHNVLKHLTPPFCVGDLVVVMGGPHVGTTGRVTRLGRRSVVVALQDTLSSVSFDFSEVQRL